MMTVREAMLRLQQYRMAIRRFGAEWQVFYTEDKKLDATNTYVTDDLEDAVIAGSKMRHRRLAAI